MEEIAHEDSPNGWAEIQGGDLLIHDPASNGVPALLIPQKGVQLRVNGLGRLDPTPVTTQDQVEIELPPPLPPEDPVVIRLSEDGLTATAFLQPIQAFRLVDQARSTHVPLVPEPTLEYPKPEGPQLVRALAATRVAYGFVEEGVWSFLTGQYPEMVVAQGLPPEPGTPDQWEILFPAEEASLITAGEVLARRTPGTPGSPGTDVRGDLIPLPEPEGARLQAGLGTEWEGEMLRAACFGRVWLRPEREYQTIEVTPTTLVDGNLEGDHTNFRCHTLLLVRGNISDHQVVWADLGLEIQGSVAEAEILSGGPVTVVGNVLSSRIMAGGRDKLPSDLVQRFDTLRSQLASLLRHLLATEEPPGEWRKALAHLFRIVQEKIEGSPVRNGYMIRRLAIYLRRFLHLSAPGPEDYAKILKAVLSSLEEFSQGGLDTASVETGYVMGSTIIANGDLLVREIGCIQSEVFVGGQVDVRGILRGGQVTAKGDVSANEIGSPAGLATLVRVPSDRKISSPFVHPGTTLVFGLFTKEIKEVQKFVVARLEGEHVILVS